MSGRGWQTPFLVVVVVVTNVLGNFCLSWGMKHRVAPWVLAGVTLLVLWVLSRVTLLSRADLSYVLPVTSIGYVLNAVMGFIFLGERISGERWTGTLLIVAGTALVGLTTPRGILAEKR